ncbi:hypothetical protein LguiA_016459 [Lonicera macranthoides]
MNKNILFSLNSFFLSLECEHFCYISPLVHVPGQLYQDQFEISQTKFWQEL